MLLHKDKGVNPKLTFCRRCGGEAGELVMVGAADYKDTCDRWGMVHYGGAKNKKCQGCGNAYEFKRERLGEFERLPATEPCDKCKAELAELQKEISLGGVPWRCKDCKSEGVIKHDVEWAIMFRKEHPKEGVELDKEQCLVCLGHTERPGSGELKHSN